jgi:hypothetical protein
VQINQIDVRAQIQLTHPELAHRKNAEAADLARSLAEKTNRKIERGADTFIRQLRHRTRRIQDADPIEQVGNRDLHPHPAHEFSKLGRCLLTIQRVDRGPLLWHRRKQSFDSRIARLEEHVVPSRARRRQLGRDQLRRAKTKDKIFSGGAIAKDVFKLSGRILGELEQECERQSLVGRAFGDRAERLFGKALIAQPPFQAIAENRKLRRLSALARHH